MQKDNILKRNVLFNIRKKHKEKSIFEKRKNLCLILSVILSLLFISLIYFYSDYSNIYRAVVNGNIYLEDKDILELSELSTDDKFLLILKGKIEDKIKTNPLISEVKVNKNNGNLISIDIKEKKLIGYGYDADSLVLFTDNEEVIPLDNKYLYLISKIPFIDGFTLDEIKQIGKNLSECDHQIIDEISEIHSYPELKYQNIELVMRDGNYIFTSAYGLKILNHYHDMRSSYLSNKKTCYYFEDISGNAFASACPWEESEEEIIEENIEIEEENEE